MSADLQWYLIRKNNAFVVKRAVDGPVFSREAGNLLNLHSFKYSGLVNNKTVSVAPSTETRGITITTRVNGANPRHIKAAQRSVSLKTSTGPRKIAKILAAETAGKGYRADLRQPAIARASAIARAQKEAANPSAVASKKPRSKAGKAALKEAPAAEASA